MKSYKDFKKVNLGSSKISSLTVRSPLDAAILRFVEPGQYSAYLVEGPADIGAHYSKVFSCNDWIRIYDDEALSFAIKGKEISVYRASERGCIIQVFHD